MLSGLRGLELFVLAFIVLAIFFLVKFLKSYSKSTDRQYKSNDSTKSNLITSHRIDEKFANNSDLEILVNLKKMKDEGLITKEDYEIQKKKILIL